MSDLLQVSDLERAKLHDTFHSEAITGKVGGLAGGADIDSATNAATGQVQATLPSLLNRLGVVFAGNFSEGFTIYYPNQAGFDGADLWRFNGTIPSSGYLVSAGVTPTEPTWTKITFENASNVTWQGGKSVAYSLDDLQGFTDALFAEAGIVPSGNPDTVVESQRVYAMKKLCGSFVPSISALITTKVLLGSIVGVLGFNVGDGHLHQRVIGTANLGLGVLLDNGLWANLVHSGEINVGSIGWKNDGTPNLIVNGALADATYVFNGGHYVFDFTNTIDPFFKCFTTRYGNVQIHGNGSKMTLINGTQLSNTMFSVSANDFFAIKDCDLYFDRASAPGWATFNEFGHAISINTSSYGGEVGQDWTKRISVENVRGYYWTGDTLCLWGCEDAYVNNVFSYQARRNGFSLAAVKNFVAGYMYSEGTTGLAPMAGLDVELDIPCEFTQKIFIETFESKNNAIRGLLFVDTVKNADVTINTFISDSEQAFEAISTYSSASKFLVNNMDTKTSTGFVYKTTGVNKQVEILKMNAEFVASSNSPFIADSADPLYNGKMFLGEVYLSTSGTMASIANFAVPGSASDKMELVVTRLSVNDLTKVFTTDDYADRYFDYTRLDIRDDRPNGASFDFDSFMSFNRVDLNGMRLNKTIYKLAKKEFLCTNSVFLNSDEAVVPFYKNGVLDVTPFNSSKHFTMTFVDGAFHYRDVVLP